MRKCSNGGCKPAPAPNCCTRQRDCKQCRFKGNTLKELVEFYTRNCRDSSGPPKPKPTFAALLDAAKQMRWPGEKGKDSHQWRLAASTISNFAGELDANKAAVKRCSTFEDVFALIEKLGNETWGVGPLTIYDTTLRLCLYRGLLPAEVYLHAGARDGARHINPSFVKERKVKRERFPQELHVLKPWQIEDFLCVCKEQLRKLSLSAGGI